MKRITTILPITIAVLAVFSGCNKKMEEYEQNPNGAESVNSALIFRGIASDMNNDEPWSLISRWNQFDCCNYNYYGDQRYDWTGASLNYLTLENVQKMEEEAAKRGLPAINPYAAIGKFQRAFFFYRMTSLVGDLPLTEALKGKDNVHPAYDTQKSIFQQILTWLDDANNELTQLLTTGDKSLDGDIYYDNDLRQWQKAVNSFRLRVIIALSKKIDDGDLNLKSQLANIVSDKSGYPIFESSDDDLQYIYSSFNKYPSNPDNLGFDATRYNMSATYLDNLVMLKDPRTYITAEPATYQLRTNHKTPSDITAYVGAPSGEDLANMSSKMSDVDNAAYSVRSRGRYYSSYSAEPGILIGFAEQCFNIAEAINRGWINGDAEEYYKKGIKASLRFYGVPVDAPGTVSKNYDGMNYSIPFDFEGVYYQQPTVKYKGNSPVGLKQILMQKYLAFFQGSGWEAYFNWRRTGIPEFSTGVGTGNSGVIPKRFQYPVSERDNNTENNAKAVSDQYGGSDDINASMWLIK
ncbi:SusD/RagB family nutrient-binding outer membrane lipoprotein [Flavihumibacter petaseus]|uniref:SusD/RagB family nutrient-binding outer membrane lipoprotein n=1 Tax=Flavihumibacter petaseus NBRC 106054 TaxID=1220578 RepID=A0A0E9MXM6_9BACT|nr:SusD/RagB family nutrient-binding outer membrane lipoprotein [Flavihumibacter petaseus]GAO42462.1 hypothetical protein FPE01S_01_14770 [Flavihumibacter petaseus NBRC 106054]